jgi:hypothetical protein
MVTMMKLTPELRKHSALMLYEQGKLLVDDPVAKYFPKFAEIRVGRPRRR